MKCKALGTASVVHFASAVFLTLFSSTATALLIDFADQPLTVGATSISATTSGVTVTATAYHVEFVGSTSTIYGPFTTGTVRSRQVFGTDDTFNSGLGLWTAQDLGQRDTDRPSGGIQPGFDNIPSGGDSPPSIQFALFNFDRPVNISQVIVDDTSNNDRDVWVAGGNSSPDLTSDFLTAFRDFTVINSADDAGDGRFAHSFGPFLNISFFGVGTPPPNALGDVGPFASQGNPATTGYDQFYIRALNFELAANGNDDNGGPSNSVPEPATSTLGALLLLILRLLCLPARVVDGKTRHKGRHRSSRHSSR